MKGKGGKATLEHTIRARQKREVIKEKIFDIRIYCNRIKDRKIIELFPLLLAPSTPDSKII